MFVAIEIIRRNFIRVEDRLMNYLLAGELFTKINHKPLKVKLCCR